MDAVEKENTERQKQWSVALSKLSVSAVLIPFIGPKIRKSVRVHMPSYIEASISYGLCNIPPNFYVPLIGREVKTNRKVAIKKIKVGQFKDGLDMSAIREVKYLRELRHQNVIEVRSDSSQ